MAPKKTQTHTYTQEVYWRKEPHTQKTQTQHTQEDVLQAVYAGLRMNATGAEIFPHRHHLKQQHKQQAGAWEQIQQTYPLQHTQRCKDRSLTPDIVASRTASAREHSPIKHLE